MSFYAERAAWEREYWRALLARHPGNVAQAAREAGIHRQCVYRIVKRLGLFKGKLLHRYGNDAWRALG